MEDRAVLDVNRLCVPEDCPDAEIMLLAVPRARVPRALSFVLLALAGASLWIYLTHMMLRDVMRRMVGFEFQLLGVALSLVGGVALWLLWSRGSAAVRRMMRRPPQSTVDVAI